MKIDLKTIFDRLDLQKTQQMAKQNISIECDDEIIERIKENTFSKLELSNNKKKLFIKNIKQTDLKRLIAISIAFVIVCGGISVVAVVGFMPDDTLSEYFNANDFINYIGTGG